MITIQNADAALKDYYLDAFSSQLNDNISPFFSAIEKNSDTVYGKQVKLSVIQGFTGNVYATAEDGDLPDPYQNRYTEITLPLKNLYGTIEITDKALRAARDSSGSFVNLLNAEMEGLVSSAKQNFSRMLFGNGSGKLAKIVKKNSNTKYIVDNAYLYFTGLRVDIYNISGNVIKDSDADLYIAQVDPNTKAVTFNKEITEDIVSGSIYIHGSKDQELSGLGVVFDDRKIYDHDKLHEAYFAPHKVDCENVLTEQKLSDMLDYLEENFNSKVNMIICSYKTRKQIASLIDANRRVVNTIDARTGYGAVTVNDVPVYADKYCPDGRILFLNTDDFLLAQLCDWEWLEDEDGKILKQIPGKAAYSATLVKYAELICKKPCGQGMLYNFDPPKEGA